MQKLLKFPCVTLKFHNRHQTSGDSIDHIPLIVVSWSLTLSIFIAGSKVCIANCSPTLVGADLNAGAPLKHVPQVPENPSIMKEGRVTLLW